MSTASFHTNRACASLSYGHFSSFCICRRRLYELFSLEGHKRLLLGYRCVTLPGVHADALTLYIKHKILVQVCLRFL
jgi:hypothetical protein